MEGDGNRWLGYVVHIEFVGADGEFCGQLCSAWERITDLGCNLQIALTLCIDG